MLAFLEFSLLASIWRVDSWQTALSPPVVGNAAPKAFSNGIGEQRILTQRDWREQGRRCCQCCRRPVSGFRRLRRTRHSRLALSAHPQARSFPIADCGYMAGRSRQSEQRHICVKALILASVNHVGFVPDADAAVRAHALIEVFPHLQVDRKSTRLNSS